MLYYHVYPGQLFLKDTNDWLKKIYMIYLFLGTHTNQYCHFKKFVYKYFNRQTGNINWQLSMMGMLEKQQKSKLLLDRGSRVNYVNRLLNSGLTNTSWYDFNLSDHSSILSSRVSHCVMVCQHRQSLKENSVNI